MKLSTKIILPIILISALLILLAGCFGIPDSSPGYTPGSITGRIMVPEDCSDCLTEGPCLKGISDFIPSHWVPAEEAIVTVIPHATLTDEDGYYTLTNVEPGVYYVITATYKNLVLKDVVEPDGVKAGKTYDAGTANCESTALALVVEYLLDMGLDTDEIETTLETYIETDKFADLVDTVCCIIEDCDNITNYCCLVECDIPEFTPELESITVNTGSMNLCLNDSKSITPLVSVIAHYTEGPSKTVTSLATITYSSNNDSIASINGTTVTGNALGSTSINVSATYIEGGITVDSTGTVPVNVIDCSTCIPELNSLTVVLGNTTPMTLCNGATTTINSSHIASIIAHYTCEAPDVTLLLSDCSYVSENSGIASVSGLNVTGNSVGNTNIVVSYTNGGKTVTSTQKVPVKVTDCTTLTSITVTPTPMNLCKAGTGGTETGTIVTTAHYSDGSSMVVTPNSYVIGNTNIVASVSAAGLVKSGSTTGSTTVTVTYEGKTAIVTVNVTDCTPPCESTKLKYFSLEIQEGSSWNEYLGGFSPGVTTYSVMATKNASHFRFTVDAECEGDAKLYYNWYRGISCTDDWLTGESGYSETPPSWIPITSGGTYPTSTSDRPVCNKGGNVLFIKVTNAGNTKIYKVYVDRPNP